MHERLSTALQATGPVEGPPEWLASGKRVLVIPGSSKEPRREAIVRSVDWPWLVYLDGEVGAVHPLRCLPLTTEATP